MVNCHFNNSRKEYILSLADIFQHMQLGSVKILQLNMGYNIQPFGLLKNLMSLFKIIEFKFINVHCKIYNSLKYCYVCLWKGNIENDNFLSIFILLSTGFYKEFQSSKIILLTIFSIYRIEYTNCETD